MIPVLVLSACGPAAPFGLEQLPDSQVQASPTLEESGAAATESQSTDPEPQAAPALPQFDARVTAVRSGVRIIRSGGTEIEVQEDKTMDVQVEDGIEVIKLEGKAEQSYSILDFSDDLEVELFSNTSIVLADLREVAGGATHISLHLEGGHMFVHLNQQATTQLTVQTPAATIRILSGSAEFDVCHNEGLTCVLVKRGVVEVVTEDKTEVLRAGEASQILRDQNPSSPICAPLSRFTDWEESYRQFADTPALGTEISALPQEACPLTAAGLPSEARILYQDQFINPFSGWAKGKIDTFIVRYAGLRHYRVQAQNPDAQYLAFAPNEQVYGDVNIDVRAIAGAETIGDFRYGMIFRRSGEDYYAFIVSPVNQAWYFLKSSADGLETLREGTDDRMRGLESRETLRAETYGSNFLLFINDRFIALVSDAEYSSGEVGLFVETIDNIDAQVRFDSIIVWDMPSTEPVSYEPGREYCFNTTDDDADKLADRADPDCQRIDRTATPLPQPTNTSIAPRTATPQPTLIAPTNTTVSTNTPIPQPTITKTPRPPTRTRTSTPQHTNTPRPPTRTRTSTPQPTNTNPPPATTAVPPTATDQPTVAPTDPPPTDPPPTDPPPTDPPPTDPPATDPPTP